MAAMQTNALAMQEFTILPVGAATSTEVMKMGCEVYHKLKAIIKEKHGLHATLATNRGALPTSDPMKRG